MLPVSTPEEPLEQTEGQRPLFLRAVEETFGFATPEEMEEERPDVV